MNVPYLGWVTKQNEKYEPDKVASLALDLIGA